MKSKQMRNKTKSALKLFSLALTAASWLAAMPALTAGQTEAATLTWDASGTGRLTDGGGAWEGGTYWWSGGPSDVLWTPGSDAVFGNGGTGGAVTLGSPTTVNSLTMKSFSGTYTLGTAGLQFTLNNGITDNSSAGATTIISPLTLGVAQTWLNNSTNLLTVSGDVDNGGNLLTVGGSGDTTVSGGLSDTGGLTMNGAGTLTLSGANTYSGDTAVNAGTLVASGKNALAGTTRTSVAGGATLVLSGTTGNAYEWPPTTLTGAGTVSMPLGQGENAGLEYDMGAFTGILDLTNGMLCLNTTYSPGFVSPTNGTIKVENDTTLYLGWTGFSLNSTVELCGGEDDGEGYGVLRGDTATLYGAVILETNSTIGSLGTAFTVNAVIGDGGNGYGFTNVGSGTVILAATNTYSGPTTISAGTLQCNNPFALGIAGALNINAGQLNLNYTGDHVVSALTLGGVAQPPGTYGSSSSSAPVANQNDSYFAGTGTVTVPGPAMFVTFQVPGAIAASINENALTVTVLMPPGAGVANLAPTYTLSSGTCVPASGSTHNFTGPVTYTVTDGATVNAYTVTVTFAPIYCWAGPNDGNWTTAANWDNTVPGAANVAVFSDSTNAGATVNLDANITVSGLLYNNLVTNQTIASKGGYTLTLNNGTVEVDGGTFTIGCPIGTTNGFWKTGSGVLDITGAAQVTYNPANSWVMAPVSGVTLSGNGSWTAVNDWPVMDVTGTVTINDNATLDWSSSVPGIALRGGENGIIVQNGGIVKGVPNPTGWACCSGPGLIIGGNSSYFGGTGPSEGEYDLNGGKLIVGSIWNINDIDASGEMPPLPPDGSAVFRFNGGILQGTTNDLTIDQNIVSEGCTNLMGNLSAAYVGLGGAKIDVATFYCGINQALLHDPALGDTLDGGLHAMSTGGPGTLALYQIGTFNGPLVIDSGVTVKLGYVGNANVSALSLGGVSQPMGTYGSSSSPAANKNDTYFSGTGTVTVSALIAGFAEEPTSGPLPLQVVFTDTSTSPVATITNWSWNFGNGVTLNYTNYVANVTNTYSAFWATYPVTLIVSDSKGRTATNVSSITVTQPLKFVDGNQNQLATVVVNIGPNTVSFASGIQTFDFGGLTGFGTLFLEDALYGCVTLAVGGSGPDTEFDGVLTGCGGLTKVGGNTFTLASANNTYLGDTVVSNGTLNVRGAIPGLWEGLVANGNNAWDTTNPIPHDSILLSDRWAQSTTSGGDNVFPGWGNDTTWGYTGYFHNAASSNVVYTFGKNFDDSGLIEIDGIVLINDTTYSDFVTTNYTLSPGWHTLELRLGQGGGGVGPQGQMTNAVTSQSIGLGWSTDGGTTWNAFSDPGDGSELEAFNGDNVLPTNTTLRIVSPAVVNLGGSNTVEYLYIDGTPEVAGTWGSATSDAAHSDSHFTGNGMLVVSATAPPTTIAVTLTITSDGSGNYWIGGSTTPATPNLTLHLYKSSDLSPESAGFSNTGATATTGSDGTFRFSPPRVPKPAPGGDGVQALYRVE
jgi:autotransporter-associated beta strand protein